MMIYRVQSPLLGKSLYIFLSLVLLLLVQVTAQPQPMNLTILHVNDIHSRLDEEPLSVNIDDLPVSVVAALPEGKDHVNVNIGGLPRLVSLFDNLQTEAEVAGRNVLRLHAGDEITGSLYYTSFNSTADSDLMQYFCFDAFELGNHEFDDGDASLARFLMDNIQSSSVCDNNKTTQALSANLVPGPDSPLFGLMESGAIGKYMIKDINDGQEQVGIIGINTRNKTLRASSPDPGTNILDERETTMRYVAELEAMGINKIIVLSHGGYDMDMRYLADIPGVDIIVGGDSHSLLGNATQLAYIATTVGDYPTIIRNKSGDDDDDAAGTVCIVQAWAFAHGMGKLDVTFDETGKVTSCTGSPVFPFDPVNFDPPLNGTARDDLVTHLESTGVMLATPEDEETANALLAYSQLVDEIALDVIADVPEDICFEKRPGEGRSGVCDVQETLLQGGGVCNLVSQGWLNEIKHADIAITNAGSCREDIIAGDFTVGDCYTQLPFKNQMVSFPMKGAQVLQLVEELVLYSFPYGAGLRFDVFDGNAELDRVRNVEVNAGLAQDEWVPLDMEATYTMLTTNYLADGGSGVTILGDIASLRQDLYLGYAETFLKYVKRVGVLLDPPKDTYSCKSFTTEAEGVIENTTTTTEAGTGDSGEADDGGVSEVPQQSTESGSVTPRQIVVPALGATLLGLALVLL